MVSFVGDIFDGTGVADLESNSKDARGLPCVGESIKKVSVGDPGKGWAIVISPIG